MSCARNSAQAWRVATEHGALTVTEMTLRDRHSGPELPFRVPNTPENVMFRNAARHVLAVEHGFLVGLDHGEWGGALHVFSADGQQHTMLAKDNVHGLVTLGDEIVSIEGYEGLGTSRGNLRWLRHDGGTWHEVALVPLDAGPRTFFATDEALYVLTYKSLVRVTHDHRMTTIQPLPLDGVSVQSMAFDDAGRLWIGMRHFVVRLEQHGYRYDETWFVKAGCAKVRFDAASYDCVCEG